MLFCSVTKNQGFQTWISKPRFSIPSFSHKLIFHFPGRTWNSEFQVYFKKSTILSDIFNMNFNSGLFWAFGALELRKSSNPQRISKPHGYYFTMHSRAKALQYFFISYVQMPDIQWTVVTLRVIIMLCKELQFTQLNELR